MATQISDGYKAYTAKVDEDQRLHVFSVQIPENEQATEEGDSYNINTGTVNLTSANESGVAYLKNNETKDYHLQAIAIGIGNSTGGTGECQIQVVLNPTGGTVISDASAVAMNINRNAGSSKTFTADAFKGAEGKTLTGGIDYSLFYQNEGAPRGFYGIDTVIPQGKSISVLITPPASNTSVDVYVAFIGHLENEANKKG